MIVHITKVLPVPQGKTGYYGTRLQPTQDIHVCAQNTKHQHQFMAECFYNSVVEIIIDSDTFNYEDELLLDSLAALIDKGTFYFVNPRLTPVFMAWCQKHAISYHGLIHHT